MQIWQEREILSIAPETTAGQAIWATRQLLLTELDDRSNINASKREIAPKQVQKPFDKNRAFQSRRRANDSVSGSRFDSISRTGNRSEMRVFGSAMNLGVQSAG